MQALMDLCILYLILAQFLKVKADNKCMECASTNLKGRWGLTGFTQTFRDQSFTATCASGSDTDHYVTCSGYCMSYLFQDPDLTSSGEIELMVVRGCQPRLLGLQNNANSAVDDQTSDVSYCEYDKDLERVDSQGNTVYVKALVEFCSGDTCNTKVKDFSTATTCTGPNYSGSSTDRLCYKCNSLEENCNRNEEQCNKKYCLKTLIQFHDLFAIHKACSDINLFGNGHGCATSDLVTIPGNLVKLNGEITHCFCNDKDYCNGTNTVTLHVMLFFMLLLKIW